MKSLLGIGAHQNTLQTIYQVDYKILHQRMAHPSDEVMRRASKFIRDFPCVNPPKEDHICPGCAQGKMSNKSFPPSTQRATEPFELIHSDLKSFPIESYHRFKYSIVFYDDYTSHAWTVNLHSKDTALPATKHFLAMVETRYRTKVRKWMSDAGGEYTSKAFKALLNNKGIETLQSIPYVHQQNGRAERLIRTLMEKAESMRLQACLPQSWWEFALNHATHVYNLTPQKRLHWRTPSEILTNIRPSVDHLRVLGCAAYVFIPAEVQTNKLAPKSELMVYLGTHSGGKGWIFMRGPNNVIFSAAHALFDESMFPRCPKQQGTRANTQLQTPAPMPSPCQAGDNCQCPIPGNDIDSDDGEPAPVVIGRRDKGKNKETRIQARQREIEEQIRRIPVPSQAPPVTMPPHPEPQAPLPRRSTREKKLPKKFDTSVYGKKHPVAVEKDITRLKDWKKVVGEPSSLLRAIPGPSSHPLPVEESSDDEDPDIQEDALIVDPSDEEEGDVEEPLEPSSEEEINLLKLCREGGVAFQHFLISKVISPIPAETLPKESPKEWTYRDILRLPQDSLMEWKAACERELKALNKRNVFELVPRPKRRKVIKNRWVFDVKDDGRKRARLVAKGFSQVEGLDFDQVFSPVVRFETVRLLLAMAALGGWVAYGLDVRNAYLYGELDEEIYMEQPEGFREPGKGDFVC